MSAPDTNVKKQQRRHRPVLIGVAVAVAVAVVGFFGVYVFGTDEDVDEAASGEIIEAE